MRASHITLLSLAASIAAPVFAAPIPYLNTRSEDGGAALSARDSHDGCTESTSENHTSQPHSDDPGEFIARDSMDDLITAISNRKTRRSDVVERNVPRDVTSESLAARVTSDDYLAAMLSDRSSGQDIEARGLFSDFLDIGITLLNNFGRDLTPEELAGRDGVDDLLSTLSNHATREPSPSAPKTVARDSSTSEDFVKALLNSRGSSMGKLAGRDAIDDYFASYLSNHATREPSPSAPKTVVRDSSTSEAFVKALLNSRDSSMGKLADRDAIDDYLASYLSNHATREPSPSAPKTVARDSSTSEAFVKALLNSRGSSMGKLAGRDAVDDYFVSYLSNHATRKSSPQQETQARSVPDSTPKTAARDSSTSKAFIKALLNTRDSGKDITPDDMLRLASLASRTLDELD